MRPCHGVKHIRRAELLIAFLAPFLPLRWHTNPVVLIAVKAVTGFKAVNPLFGIFRQRIIGVIHIEPFGIAADFRDFQSIKQRAKARFGHIGEV